MNVADLEIGEEYFYSKTDWIVLYVGKGNDGMFDYYVFCDPWMSRLEIPRWIVNRFVRPISTHLASQDDAYIDHREYSDVWAMEKDGKQYFGHNLGTLKHLMRK